MVKRQLAELVNEQVEDMEVVEEQQNLKVEDRARKRRWSPQRRAQRQALVQRQEQALESPERALE